MRIFKMTSHLLKILMVLATAALIAGCRLNLVAPTGGDVTSASGTRNCAGGSTCEFIIADNTFNETFTAVPKPGYVFSKWSAGDGFQCANSTNPVCAINNTAYAMGSNAAIDNYIRSGVLIYAMPLFTYVGGVSGDSDKDGIVGIADQCNAVYGNSVWGCVISGSDSDGDGVPNYLDWVVNSWTECTDWAYSSNNGCKFNASAVEAGKSGVTDYDGWICYLVDQSRCPVSPW
jgi:Divergent InlB B-repeat domain